MKEKKRTLIVAGSVLVALLAVIILVPKDALDQKDSDLSAEQIESEKFTIAESLEAIKDFNAREVDNPKAYYNEYIILANSYNRIGDNKKAREAYLNAIRYSENPEVDYSNLIAREESNGNYKEARTILENAIKENPENFAYWNLLIELEKDHFDLAGDALEKKIEEAITATDRSIGSLVTYAFFLEEKQDYAKALEYWRELSANNPDFQSFYDEEIARLEALMQEAQS